MEANRSPTRAHACGSVKPFNNQTSAGVFRPGWDTAKLVHDAELTTDVQDVLLEL